MQPLSETPEAYVMHNTGNENEFYFLENRQPIKWFKYVDIYDAPSGILVTHIDFDNDIWEANTPNNDPNHQRYIIVPASGKLNTFFKGEGGEEDYYATTESDFQGHLYPYQGKDSLTSTVVACCYLLYKKCRRI